MAVSENDLIVGPLVPALGVSVISLDFYFEDETWLEVYKSGSETPLILNTDYTVSGEGTESGSVTLTTPADGVDSYSVYLQVPLERTTDLQERGGFRSGPVNLELDRLWQAIQRLATDAVRTFRFSRTASVADPLFSDDPTERQGRALIFSADGTGLDIGPTSGDIADAQANAEAAAAALDEFTDLYLGEKAADPSTDNDGDALQTGAIYFNTVANRFRVWNGAAWVTSYLIAGDSPSFEVVTVTDSMTVAADLAVDTDTLVVDSADNRVGINTALPEVSLDIVGVDAVQLPVGNTAQRPDPTAGRIRRNSETGQFEGADGTDWGTLGGAGLFKGDGGETGDTVNGAKDIFRVHKKTLTVDTTIDADENAVAVGPLAIASGVTLTIASGGNLRIV